MYCYWQFPNCFGLEIPSTHRDEVHKMSETPKLRKSPRFRIPRWKKQHMWNAATRWDAPVYTLAIAIGVPLMSYFVTDTYYKLLAAMLLFAITHAYWALETHEMVTPVLRHNVVREENANAQIDSMQVLKRYGAQGAAVIWILFLVWYDAVYWPYADWKTNAWFVFDSIFVTERPVSYGWVECLIIAHTYLVSKYVVRFFNLLLFILLKAFPRAERIEEEGTGGGG